MVVLVAAVVLIGLLAVANLVLTFGVIRRLREHTELFGRMGPMNAPTMLSSGSRVGEYTATTLDGAQVSSADGGGHQLVGFLSLGCQPCTEKLPVFVERARAYPGGRGRVLAVVVGADDDGDAASYVDQLSPVARVVREEPNGPLQTVFHVQGYPAFGVIDDAGVVLTSGVDVPDLATVRV
jgi:hypothetical protein